jgi:hypothetical protein
MQAVQGCLLRGHKSTPVKHKHMLLPPACSSPLITEDLPGSWPGQYMRNEQPLTTESVHSTVPQSVRRHTLPPSVLHPATSQAKLHDVLGRKSMYVCQWWGQGLTCGEERCPSAVVTAVQRSCTLHSSFLPSVAQTKITLIN